jgi:hypothetical protein
VSILSRVINRNSVRVTLSVVAVLGLSVALARWEAGVLPVLGCAVVLGVVVVVRRALRRASARIDAIMREELDTGTDQVLPHVRTGCSPSLVQGAAPE